ncbi:MAG: GAF domain-containing protein [Thermoanaerobaculia bacterium]|nr:GAF domain-containing protein [Thermoanaerobaculia bacterium]
MAALDLAERLAAIIAAQEEIARFRLDEDAVMRLAAKKVKEVTNADGAVVEFIREDEIFYHSAVGSLEEHEGTVFDLEGSISGLAATTRNVLRSDDTETDDRVAQEISRATGSRSIIVAPLIYEDDVVALLKVVSKKPNAFDDLDSYTMRLIAGLIAAAMAHAAEYESKEISESRFRLLFERNIAGAFCTNTDGRVLEVNQEIVRILGFDTIEELMQEESWNFYPDRKDREDFLKVLLAEKSVRRYPLTLKKKDGTIIRTVTNMDIVPGEHETLILGTLLEVKE